MLIKCCGLLLCVLSTLNVFVLYHLNVNLRCMFKYKSMLSYHGVLFRWFYIQYLLVYLFVINLRNIRLKPLKPMTAAILKRIFLPNDLFIGSINIQKHSLTFSLITVLWYAVLLLHNLLTIILVYLYYFHFCIIRRSLIRKPFPFFSLNKILNYDCCY